MKKLTEADLLEKTADEIRADKQAWLDKQARNKAKKDAASKSYNKARYDALNPVKEYIEQELAGFDKLQFQVSVYEWYGSGIEVRINCNENNKFQDSVALAWNYQAVLTEEGEVKKETGSWSGLKACTVEQIESLKQTVAALEKLNSMDWGQILKITLPDFKEFVPQDLEDETKEYDYDDELNSQQIRELIGAGKAIRIKNFRDDSRWASDLFLVPVKETPKKIEGTVFSARYVDGGEDPKAIYSNNHWTEPVMKSKIKIVEPVQIIDVE